MTTHISFRLADLSHLEAKALRAALLVIEEGAEPISGHVSAGRDLLKEVQKNIDFAAAVVAKVPAAPWEKHENISQTAAIALPEGDPGEVEPDAQTPIVPLEGPEDGFKEPEPLTPGLATYPETPEHPKKRGRKPKAAVEAPPAEPEFPDTEFNHLLAVFNDQMDKGGLTPEKRQSVCKQWTEWGPARIEDLKKAIAENNTFLGKKEEAHANAEAIATANAETKEEAKPPTLDELRATLQVYTEKNTLQSGIDLLKAYGCQRVSEVGALPIEKQLEFMAAANA